MLRNNLIQISDTIMENKLEKNIQGFEVTNTFTGFVMHEFVEKSKRKVAEGNVLVLQQHKSDPNESLNHLKMNNFDFCKKINQAVFIKVRYPKSTSFLFFNELRQNLVYSLSAPHQSTDLIILENVLKTSGFVIDYLSPNIKYETKIRLDYHIDNVLENEIMINFNTVTRIGKAFGNFFGKINKKMIQKSAEAEQKFNAKVARFSRESFSQQTRSKWGKFKDGASSLNQTITNAIKPINETISAAVTNVGQKYRNSSNLYVKSIRDFTKQAQNSINEGYYTEPPQSSAKIVVEPPLNDSGKQMMGQHLISHQETTPQDYPIL